MGKLPDPVAARYSKCACAAALAGCDGPLPDRGRKKAGELAFCRPYRGGIS